MRKAKIARQDFVGLVGCSLLPNDDDIKGIDHYRGVEIPLENLLKCLSPTR